MEQSTPREKILKKIRNALIHKARNPFPKADLESDIYIEEDETPEILFAGKFMETGGNFIFCENEQELVQNISTLMTEKNWSVLMCLDNRFSAMLSQSGINVAKVSQENSTDETVSLTGCDSLVSRTGSVIVSSKQSGSRSVFVSNDIHIICAYSSQIVSGLKDALAKYRNGADGILPSFVSVISGPSRTADIERTIITGAHGPKEIYLFLTDDLLLNENE
jgi:L-lactate dehydrogenase complex protein LldG